jgi:hypothetical protein
MMLRTCVETLPYLGSERPGCRGYAVLWMYFRKPERPQDGIILPAQTFTSRAEAGIGIGFHSVLDTNMNPARFANQTRLALPP